MRLGRSSWPRRKKEGQETGGLNGSKESPVGIRVRESEDRALFTFKVL